MSFVIRQDVVEGTEDIVKFLDEYRNNEYFIDTMYWTLQLVRNNGSVCPADVYIALLESGAVKHNITQRDVVPEIADAYNNCIFYMGLLEPLGIFKCHISDVEMGKSLMTAHTFFSLIMGPRFNLFNSYVQQLYNAANAKRYTPKSYQVEALEKYMQALQEAIKESEIQPKTGSHVEKFKVRQAPKQEETEQKQNNIKTAKEAKIEANHKRWKSQQAQKRGEIIPEQIDPAIIEQRAKWREQKQKQRDKQHLPPAQE